MIYVMKIYFMGSQFMAWAQGGSWGSKDPPSRIIQGKPKEWCSGIKMP